jgi:hypothetical protein
MTTLSRWMTGTPPAVGEYNVSNCGDPTRRRWWDGIAWSWSYNQYDKLKTKRHLRAGHGKPYGIEWRGLVNEFMAVAPLATK